MDGVKLELFGDESNTSHPSLSQKKDRNTNVFAFGRPEDEPEGADITVIDPGNSRGRRTTYPGGNLAIIGQV